MATTTCKRALCVGRIGLVSLLVLLLAIYIDLLQVLPLAFSQQITEQFHLSLVQFTQLMNAYETPLVFLLLFFGFLIDITGAKCMSIIALILLTSGNYLFSIADTASALLSARFLMGIGTTFVTVSLLAFMAQRLSNKSFIVLVGVFFAVSTLSKFFGVDLHITLMGPHWEQSANRLSVIGIVLILAFGIITYRKSQSVNECRRLNLDELIHTLANRNIWLGAIIAATGYLFVYLFLSSIGPVFFHTAGQFTQPELLNLFNYGMFSLCVGLIMFALLSYCAVPYRHLLKIGYGLGIVSFVAAMLCLTQHNISIILLCVTSFASSAYILAYAILNENTCKRCLGVSFSIIFIVIYIGSLFTDLLTRHLMHDFIGSELINQATLQGPWLSIIAFVPVLFVIGIGAIYLLRDPPQFTKSTASLSSQFADCWRGKAQFGRSFWLIYFLGGLLLANVILTVVTLFDPFLIKHGLWSPLAMSYLVKTVYLIVAMPCIFKSAIKAGHWHGWKAIGIIAAIFLLLVSVLNFLQHTDLVNLNNVLTRFF